MKTPRPSPIPLHASASRAVATRQRFSGPVLLRQLTRLAPQLADASGALDVDLQAEKEGGESWLRGTVDGDLQLTCQRGLHPFAWHCHVDVVLRLVASEVEEERLLKDYEPYWVQDDRLPLRELVEDEVLLALPMMPRCDDPDCLRRLA